MIGPPKIDSRKFDDIVDQIKGMVPFYTSELGLKNEHAGMGLVMIFARMFENVIQRMNKVPENQYTAFLDTIGVKQLSAQPAVAPVTFFPAKGTKIHIQVPEQTQVASEDIIFETVRNFIVTPSTMTRAYGIDPQSDYIFPVPHHTDSDKPDTLPNPLLNENSDVINLQQHALYLGHKDMLNLPNEGKITISLFEAEAAHLLFNPRHVRWEYWGEAIRADDQDEIKQTGWHPLQIIVPNYSLEMDIILEKTDWLDDSGLSWLPGEIKELEINGLKSRWIRCVACSELIEKTRDSSFKNIQIKQDVSNDPLSPDALYSNDIPLDIQSMSGDKPIHPFGTRPYLMDAFYIGSKEVLSKKDSRITIDFLCPGLEKQNIGVIHVKGVGPTYAERLEKDGIKNVADLRGLTREKITDSISKGGSKTKTFYDRKAEEIQKAVKRGDFDQSIILPLSHLPATISTSSTFSFSDLILSWEYWDGKGWKCIPSLVASVEDGFDFLSNGTVSFDCPTDIEPTEVSGQENYWIRVRIVSGDYGKELEYVDGQWKEGTIIPPKIEDIQMSYALENKNWEHCLSYNNLNYQAYKSERDSSAESFYPFTSLEDENMSLYLGFDGKLEKGPISIWFDLDDRMMESSQPLSITWHYLPESEDDQSYEWRKLDTLDNTHGFTRSGTIEFLFPTDFVDTKILGERNYWIKALFNDASSHHPLDIQGIYLNTTNVIQAESIHDEMIGSSDGAQNQRYRLNRSPVISEQLWVDEKNSITREDMEAYIFEDGIDSVKQISDHSGQPLESWLRWYSVEDFSESNSSSRHYMIDRAKGEILFGDGVFGKIPPTGQNNIKVSYRTGGGENGNVTANKIKTLKTTVPFVDGVNNPIPARNGADTESLTDVFKRGPHFIKHLNRAVTREDFERLALSASSYIAKTTCLIKNNKVHIIILPKGMGEKPEPSRQLLWQVKDKILKQSLNLVPGQSIRVEKPSFIPISVEAHIVPVSISQATQLEWQILDTIKRFFHPLYGGFNQNGWGFGRNVYCSEIFALIEGIKGVDHVRDLKLEPGEISDGFVLINSDETVCSGNHTIQICFGDES